MVTGSSKGRASEVPPHELFVRKFAESRSAELEGLHSVVANRLNSDYRSQRNKRKRTTGHDDRIAKKRFRKRGRVAHGDMNQNHSLAKDEKKVSRRVRRSIELKKNPQSGFGISGDGTKRLRTHIWHVKRFTMSKLWGFNIPFGLHGRGKGSRALLKKLKSEVLLHDASYYGTVQLEGPQESLLSILTSMLVPSPLVNNEQNVHDILSGKLFGSAIVRHAGEQCFRPIAPVTYMWRPISSNTECCSSSLIIEQPRIDDVTTIRQLWVWIHAAAFAEAYDALNSACKSQLDIAGGSVQCISLEGHLAKLELIGSKAFQLLQKTLLPVHSSSNYEHGELEKISILKNHNQISDSAVIPLTVMDPRLSTKNQDIIVSERNHLCFPREHETNKHTVSSLSNNGIECVAGGSILWDVSKGICIPMEESDICMEKQHQREEFICVGRKTSRMQHNSAGGKNSRWCPILLLKNKNHEDSVIRCSVILPLCWAKVFWLAFMSNGAHAIGLREKQWIASEIGLPCFPLDFPDCNAYTHTMAMEKVVADQKAKLRPHSIKPLDVPIPPPWHCVQLNYEKGSIQAEKSYAQVDECGSKDMKLDDLMKNSGCPISDAEMLDCISSPSKGHILRTSSMLSDFLNTICNNHSYLFPKVPNQETCIYKFMKQKKFATQETMVVSEVEHDKGRCFLRVFLRAYSKGVFEQGAVVCEPHAADIMALTESENDNGKLQIPESVLKSYFVCLPSGEWEIRVPEDSAMRESFRWPIGFVTTGFVRGSKSAKAGAFCEATLLSRLRMEQWRALPMKQRKKDIYVLVRNMRSTAYRLALATIVLEQEEDVESM